MTSLSTGKRRYGHPALTGVLPQPWLPLKKGQSIRNGPPSAPSNSAADMTPAVVLTLRKRYSVRADAGRQRSATEAEATPGSPQSQLDEAVANPWQDLASSPTSDGRRPNQIHHRLSFDHASGVIMLPEGDWLEEESDSDEDFGVLRTDIASPDSAQGDSAVNAQVSQSPTSVAKRYSTYYHHPERRKRP